MSNCSSGCPTQSHQTYGECLRSKGMKIAYCQSHKGLDYTAQKNWDKELGLYAEARSGGAQPKTTRSKDSIAAMEEAS